MIILHSMEIGDWRSVDKVSFIIDVVHANSPCTARNTFSSCSSALNYRGRMPDKMKRVHLIVTPIANAPVLAGTNRPVSFKKMKM